MIKFRNMPLPKRALALLLCTLALLAVFAVALPILLNPTLAAPSSWIQVTDAMLAVDTSFTVTFTSTTTYDITGLLSGNATGLSIADDGIVLDTLTGRRGMRINGAGFDAPVPLSLEIKSCTLSGWFGTLSGGFDSIIDLLNKAKVRVTTQGQSSLNSGRNQSSATIHVPVGATFIYDGGPPGSWLRVQTGASTVGSAIGSSNPPDQGSSYAQSAIKEAYGAIIINGGVLYAGAHDGAGIGGMRGNMVDEHSSITINGGLVIAESWNTANGGCAIGGGSRGWGGNITINGGTVWARASLGYAVGNGAPGTGVYCPTPAVITINGGNIAVYGQTSTSTLTSAPYNSAGEPVYLTAVPATNTTIEDRSVFAHPSLSHMTYELLADASIHQYGITDVEMMSKAFIDGILVPAGGTIPVRSAETEVNNLIFFYLPQPYAQAGRTILNVQLDGAPYIAHGKTFTLRQGGVTRYTGTGANGVVDFGGSVANGLYQVYDGTTDTGSTMFPVSYSGVGVVNYYTVQFDSRGGSTVPDQVVLQVKTAAEPPVPTKAGTSFVKWVNSVNLEEYDFNAPVTKPLTLLAVWDNDGTLELEKNAYLNGSETIENGESTPVQVEIGDEITYELLLRVPEITVHDESSVSVTDYLPQGLTYLSHTDSSGSAVFENDGQKCVWSWPVGEAGVFTLTVTCRVDAAYRLYPNRAWVSVGILPAVYSNTVRHAYIPEGATKNARVSRDGGDTWEGIDNGSEEEPVLVKPGDKIEYGIIVDYAEREQPLRVRDDRIFGPETTGNNP